MLGESTELLISGQTGADDPPVPLAVVRPVVMVAGAPILPAAQDCFVMVRLH